jgi:hypothetical protein
MQQYADRKKAYFPAVVEERLLEGVLKRCALWSRTNPAPAKRSTVNQAGMSSLSGERPSTRCTRTGRHRDPALRNDEGRTDS